MPDLVPAAQPKQVTPPVPTRASTQRSTLAAPAPLAQAPVLNTPAPRSEVASSQREAAPRSTSVAQIAPAPARVLQPSVSPAPDTRPDLPVAPAPWVDAAIIPAPAEAINPPAPPKEKAVPPAAFSLPVPDSVALISSWQPLLTLATLAEALQRAMAPQTGDDEAIQAIATAILLAKVRAGDTGGRFVWSRVSTDPVNRVAAFRATDDGCVWRRRECRVRRDRPIASCASGTSRVS
ncbi:MAG: hypothetical protein WBG32_08500 [Nodosilinea sp.]